MKQEKATTMQQSEIQLPSNRKFGLFFTVVFALAGAYFWSSGVELAAQGFLLAAVLFLVVALLKADLLLPLNKLWMRLGLLLGMIVSPIVLGIIFFGIFTPVSLMMKLVGRDELRLKIKARDTHWKPKETLVPQSESFKNQF